MGSINKEGTDGVDNTVENRGHVFHVGYRESRVQRLALLFMMIACISKKKSICVLRWFVLILPVVVSRLDPRRASIDLIDVSIVVRTVGVGRT